MAVLDLMKITKTMSDGKLIGALKSQLETWTPLFKRLCIGVEEEKAVIVALENAAIGGGEISDKLSTGPSFRFRNARNTWSILDREMPLVSYRG